MPTQHHTDSDGIGKTQTDVRENGSAVSVEPTTYSVKLYSPLFYASKGGSVIETDPVVSATALMHAIGYEYCDLQRMFAFAGEKATTPDYSPLRDLGFFTSEMVPVGEGDVVTERTFRTMTYHTERRIESQDDDACDHLTGTVSSIPRRIDGKNAGWHKVREFVGIPPGVEFELTVWESTEYSGSLPESMGFRLGIDRSGEVRATKQDEVVDTVRLNQYLIQTVFETSDELMRELMQECEEFNRGNDGRTARIIGVDTEWVSERLMPTVLASGGNPK